MNNPTFLRRSYAFLLDFLILYIFIMPGFSSIMEKIVPGSNFSEILNSYNGVSQSSIGGITLIMVLISLYFLTYFSITQYLTGGTIGMTLMRLVVVSENKKDVSFLKSVIRNLFCIPFFPFILLWAIEPIYLLIKGKRMMEILTKTRVVYQR